MMILMYVNLSSIGDVVASTLASSVEDPGLKQPRSCLVKYYKTGICCFSAKHVSFGVSVNISRIGDVIVAPSYRVWKIVDTSKGLVLTNTIQFISVASLVSTQHAALITKSK